MVQIIKQWKGLETSKFLSMATNANGVGWFLLYHSRRIPDSLSQSAHAQLLYTRTRAKLVGLVTVIPNTYIIKVTSGDSYLLFPTWVCTFIILSG